MVLFDVPGHMLWWYSKKLVMFNVQLVSEARQEHEVVFNLSQQSLKILMRVPWSAEQGKTLLMPVHAHELGLDSNVCNTKHKQTTKQSITHWSVSCYCGCTPTTRFENHCGCDKYTCIPDTARTPKHDSPTRAPMRSVLLCLLTLLKQI